MSIFPYGITSDGHMVRVAQLAWPGGLQAEVLEFGAIIGSLSLPAPVGGATGGDRRNVVLALDDLAAYEADDRYIGQCIGRVANRIAGGRFHLDGQEIKLSVNEPPNTLHGGKVGFGQRLWCFDEAACDGGRAALTYLSAAGEEGFPGALSVRCILELVDRDTLEIAYQATTDAPTPVSLTHHLYFNLLGSRDSTILDHTLQLDAYAMTPVVAGLVPTGEIAAVAGGPFDLHQPVLLADVLARGGEQMRVAGGLDFNWIVAPGSATAAVLTSPDGMRLEVTTDQPGLQVYGGHKLTPPFLRYGGLALEPQGFPDAVNQFAFPSQILNPGQTYRRTTRYRLSSA